VQVPALQPSLAFGREQVRPQFPQFDGSFVRSASQPSPGRPLQSPKPVSQADTTHTPALQPSVAFWREQTLPHAPQLAGSESVSVGLPEQFATVHSSMAAWTSAGTHASGGPAR